jgi:hypothetical protein
MKQLFSQAMLVFSLSAVSVSSALATEAMQCKENPADQLKAEYKVTQGKSESQLWLWRDGKQVLQQHPDKKLASYYYLVKPNLIQSIRLFDEFKTGIEYQQNELAVIGEQSASWSEHYQLINEKFLTKLHLDRVEKLPCDTLAHYSGEVNGHMFKIGWLKKQKLVNNYEDKSAQSITRIELIAKEQDSEKVAAMFKQYLNYKMYDYADIGDNEDNPFIAKMIRQGFIEHGASGFYNANGESMAHEHH